MTFGFLSGSRNFCKLRWVSCEVLFLHGYARIHWVVKSFFFSHDDVDVTAKIRHNKLPRHATNPSPVQHLMHTRCVSVNTTVDPTFQERRYKNSRRSTRGQSTPPQVPTLLRSSLQHCWLRPCSCLGQVPHERHCFERPPTSNFENKHQFGPVPLLDEFKASPLLAPPGFIENNSVSVRCPTSGSPVAMQRQGSCQPPTGPHRAMGARQPPPPNGGRRYTRAAALSTANPRLPRTPACAHDAKWWPKESRKRPHRHVREVGGNGRRKRRNKSTRKNWESRTENRTGGRTPTANSGHDGTSTPSKLASCTAALVAMRKWWDSDGPGERLRNLWVALHDHLQKSPQLAQCNNNARLHIGNRGNRSRRVGWCWRTACNWCSTNSGCPRGVPRNFCKLLWVSCEIFVLHGYAWIHWATTSCPTTAYRWLFRESQLSLRTLWSAVIKLPKLSARSAASPLRLLHGALVILVRLQISQFRSLGKWIWTLCLPKSSRLFVVGSREASIDELPWEPPYNGISSSTKFSLNSCNHSGISESSEHNGSPRAVVVSFLLVFGVLLAWSSSGLPDQQIQTLALDRCHC